jgi:hypothetical protein
MHHLIFILSCLFIYQLYMYLDADTYVIKNVVKSIYLAILSLLGLFVIFPPYNNLVVKIFASLYVSNDFMGLFMVKLNTSTIFHHLVSFLFLLYVWTIDFNSNTIAQNILMYTWISSINFGVNLYLGLRKIRDVEWLRHIIKHVYLVTFIANVIYQTMYASNIVYWFLLLFIILDDIYLLYWLYK